MENTMSHVVLVRPPTVLPYATITTSMGVPSIGLAYLAGSLKAADHRVTVIDAFGEAIDQFIGVRDSNIVINGLTAPEIITRIPKSADIIGVSCMYSNEWGYYKAVIELILERFPSIPLVLGGEHITADPEYVLKKCPGVQCCVLGEGEETLVEVVETLEFGLPLKNVDGIAFLDEHGTFIKNPPRKRIRDIDNIPQPSWDESPLDNYLNTGLGMGSVRGRNMPMIASRGCPYQCTFCSNPQMWTTRWLARSPELVVEEMKHWKAKFNITHFEFYDLTTIVKKEWIIEFCNLLLLECLEITWALPSGTRSEALDIEVLGLLDKSGCHSLTYAPESGSPTTLKRIKKKVDTVKMLQSMRWAVKQNIEIKANMIIGFPGQTKREVFESYVFTLKMAWVGINDVAFFPFVPYPGSELFQYLVDNELLVKGSAEYEAFLTGNVYNELSGMSSWSEHISDRLIKFLTVGGMIWFYSWQFILRPKRIADVIVRLYKNEPRTMFERALYGIILNFIQGRKSSSQTAADKLILNESSLSS